MRINCPHCGPRGLEEFLYHGDATVKRPADGGAVPSKEWTDYVYLRENALTVTRDLSTHEILSVQSP
jgi:sarcosine oxidase subunit delta